MPEYLSVYKRYCPHAVRLMFRCAKMGAQFHRGHSSVTLHIFSKECGVIESGSYRAPFNTFFRVNHKTADISKDSFVNPFRYAPATEPLGYCGKIFW